MTLPPNNSRSPISNNNDNVDVDSLMNNREFQEMLQDYFQSNTMTLDEFMENLPRFMIETYGNNQNYDEDEDEDEDENYTDEDEDIDDNDAFMAFLHRNSQTGYRSEPLDVSNLLLRSLLAGRREAREIPFRNILPQSPPPSPVPNIVNTAASIPFFQRNGIVVPPVPTRPNTLRRVPSQLRSYTTNSAAIRFDPNAPEECKSPNSSPMDRNNELPLTSEYMRRYGHDRISLARNNIPAPIDDDKPER